MAVLQAQRWGPTKLRRLRMTRSTDGRRPTTQREIAALIGVGLDRYYQLENGHADPTPREIAALATVFGVSERSLGLRAKESRRVVVRDRRSA